ncbi:hypothetical protein U2I83_18475 [Bacillus amyloliquefaciens]|uniref:pLS20_p028 family conjugation system transmembrane protein n=1 Tax=Bacillus amyloliquefaciens TaxID=1390 RepID=UPI0032DEEB5A
MSDEELLKILQKFSDFLEIGNIFSYMLRFLGWSLIRALAWLVDGIEGVTDQVLTLSGFFKSKEITDFLSMIQPGLWILLAFSLCFLGYQLIFNKKFNREHVLINIVIAVAVIMLLGQGMEKADEFSSAARDVVSIKDKDGTLAQKIIKDNLTDVSLFDEKDWKSTKLKHENKIPRKNIELIDITEKIDKDFEPKKGEKLSKTGKSIFDKKLVMDTEGNQGVADLKNGWFDFFPEQYYRWQWDFWTMAITLFVTGMTLLFIAIKLAKLMYELAFNHILASIMAYIDIANGQRLKEVLKTIGCTFFIFVMVFLSMRVYVNYTAFISDHLNGLAYVVAIIAGSIAVIDGPILCERIFGIDAGLKSGWGLVAGSYALMKTANNTVGGVQNLATKAMGAATSGALYSGAALAGAAAGLAGGKSGGNGPSLFEQMNSSKDEKSNGNSDKSNGKGEKNANGKGAAGNKQESPSLESEMNKKNGNSANGQTAQGNQKGKKAEAENVQGSSPNITLQDEMNNTPEENGNPGTPKPENSSLQDEMNNATKTGEAKAGAAGGQEGEKPSSLQNEMNEKDETEAGAAGGQEGEKPSSLQNEMNEKDGTEAGAAGGQEGEKPSSLQNEMNEKGGTEADTHSSHEIDGTSPDHGAPGSSGGHENDGPTSLHGEMDGTSQTDSQEGVKPTPTVSTSDIPLPNHARTEQRTLGQYASDKLKEKMNSSRRVQNMKKTYNISKNTMESLRGGNVMKRGANNVSKPAPQRSNSTARSGSLANHGSGSAFRNMGENRQVTRIDSEIDEE